MVCPPELKERLFTTAAVDNIDYNPSSTTASGSFHGTGISLFQHPCNEDGDHFLNELGKLNFMKGSQKSIDPLPAFYTTIPPISHRSSSIVVPEGVKQASIQNRFTEVQNQEIEWLDHVSVQCLCSAGSDESISWSAYHAEISHGTSYVPAHCSLSLKIQHTHLQW